VQQQLLQLGVSRGSEDRGGVSLFAIKCVLNEGTERMGGKTQQNQTKRS